MVNAQARSDAAANRKNKPYPSVEYLVAFFQERYQYERPNEEHQCQVNRRHLNFFGFGHVRCQLFRWLYSGKNSDQRKKVLGALPS